VNERLLTVEPLTAEAFEPFGAYIGSKHDDWEGDRPRPATSAHPMVELPFDIDGAPGLYIVRYPKREAMVTAKFERHVVMSETRIVLRDPLIMLAAAPDGDGSRPDPDSVRAFLIAPGQGVLMPRGTWHAVTSFPVASAYVDIVFIGEQDTEDELTAGGNLDLTDVYDFGDELSFAVDSDSLATLSAR
jgi:ureidoglycolate lyase